MDVFDINWDRITNAHMGYYCFQYNFDRSECLDKLLDYARKLSKPFLHVRVDFYIVDNIIIFGEVRFNNGAWLINYPLMNLI